MPINTENILISAPYNVPSFKESNKRRHFQNGMKVSDVSYPMSFPTKATYRSGNFSAGDSGWGIGFRAVLYVK